MADILDRLADPESNEVGAYVRLEDGTVGQVWALDKGTRVWVADGTSYVLTQATTLVVVGSALDTDSDDEPGLFEMGGE